MGPERSRADPSLETFSKLVEVAYDCALDPSRWQEVLDMTIELGLSQSGVLAKTHLQHIYAKTHTSKQTEFMRLFMSAAPLVDAAPA